MLVADYLGNGTTPASNLQVFTSNAERMRIDSSGNVGIGTTSPGTRLQVAGSFSTTVLSPGSCGCVSSDVSMIPAGISHFVMGDGDFTVTATLPATATNGQRMILSSRASFSYTINTTNTSLSTTLTVSYGQAYEFVYVGGLWLRIL